MISEASPRARFWIDSLAKAGRAHFTSAEARQALGGTADAVRLSLHRLSKQTLIASPGRGFYVIVPPEYRSLGCLPAEQFIPALMKHLKLPYYAAMLSAAQFYGAAHHAPQEFQVMVARRRRRLVCGSVQVAFFFRPVIASVATRSFNTSRGEIAVSTPEFTAIYLVGYHQHPCRACRTARSGQAGPSRGDGPHALGAAAWLSA
jgi:predicted transcriptional regulator of viral defense system